MRLSLAGGSARVKTAGGTNGADGHGVGGGVSDRDARTAARMAAVRHGLVLMGLIIAAWMYLIVGDRTWANPVLRRTHLLGGRSGQSLRGLLRRGHRRVPLFPRVRPGLLADRAAATRGLRRRLDAPAGGGRAVAGPALAGGTSRPRPAGQPGDPDRQHPPAPRRGDRPRVPLARDVGVRPPHEGHAGCRARLVRRPAGVAVAGDRSLGHGGDRRRQRRGRRPPAVARLDRPAPARRRRGVVAALRPPGVCRSARDLGRPDRPPLDGAPGGADRAAGDLERLVRDAAGLCRPQPPAEPAAGAELAGCAAGVPDPVTRSRSASSLNREARTPREHVERATTTSSAGSR